MSGDVLQLRLRPVEPEDQAELVRIHGTEEVAHWWDQPAEGFPFEDDDPTRLAIVVGDQVAGMVQFDEEEDPKYRHASVDLFLDPVFHGRGLGTEAVRQVVEMLIQERAHHRISIDPATENAAAIRAYEKAGFRRIGVMKKAERDSDGSGWHDQLLMELVVEPGAEQAR